MKKKNSVPDCNLDLTVSRFENILEYAQISQSDPKSMILSIEGYSYKYQNENIGS